MRLALIFPQLTHVMRGGGRTLPPNAIFYLAAILRRQGHQVRTEALPRSDLFAPDFVADLVHGCDVLGISANTINWRFARHLACLARAHRPELPIVLGGLHPSLFHQHVMATTPVDFVVRGEGEIALPELLAAIEADSGFEAVGSLTWRDPGGELRVNPDRPLLTSAELAAQPAPAFDLLPPEAYQGIAVESSRGCAFHCVFCSIPYRRSFRALDAAAFADRLRDSVDLAAPRLTSPSGKVSVYILDDCFTTHKKRAVEVFERLAPVEGVLRFGIEARADQVTERLAQWMSRHDFWLIQMGLECGYPEGLEKVDKGLSIEDIETACARLQEHGLSEATDYAFILGFPWESRDDCLRTLEFAFYLHMRYGGHISLSWYEPFPGSPLWDRREQEGLDFSQTMFDELERDWRRDPEVFYALRPRMTEKDIHEVQQVVSSIATLDSKYLRAETSDDLDAPPLTRAPTAENARAARGA